MTYAPKDDGHRAVVCKGWQWLPGMLSNHGWRVLSVEEGQIRWARGTKTVRIVVHGGKSNGKPDLTDPATLGCLLSLVRKARREPTYLPTCLDTEDEAWIIERPMRVRQTLYESEASVLVAALEAASHEPN